MPAYQYDEIDHAQRAWQRAQEDNPLERHEGDRSVQSTRPVRPLMEGRGPQLALPKAKTS